MIFAVFGDSIAYGACDFRGGWAARLRLWLERVSNYEHLLYNFSISGETSRGVLRRIGETLKLLSSIDKVVAVVAVGINDSATILGEYSIPIDEFRRNVEKIVILSRKYADETIFLGLTPVDEARTCPVFWDRNICYKNRDVMKYNSVIEEVCKRNGIHFVNLLDKLNDSSLLADGLHPNSKGHRIIFNVLRSYLVKEGIVKCSHIHLGKLVRDNIPEIVKRENKPFKLYRVDDTELLVEKLVEKLEEEVEEFIEDRNAEELADILEVVYAIAERIGADVEKVREEKRRERGGFSKGVILV